MANKKRVQGSSNAEDLPNLKVSRGEAEKLLKSQIDKGRQILELPIQSNEELEKAQAEYLKWNDYNTDLLRKIFDSPEVSQMYSKVGVGIFYIHPSFDQRIGEFQNDLKDKLNRLESIKDRLTLYGEPRQSSSTIDRQRSGVIGDKVFVVHGQDKGAKEEVARFLEKLELKPIILHEQPNIGRTLIEKFEDYSSVDYAIVLLTPDDLGRLASENSELLPRARQNVVFELGYFIGKLGRNKVCALYKKGVELPSDFNGVLYIELDEAGGWRLNLAKELKSAGFDIDMNKAVS